MRLLISYIQVRDECDILPSGPIIYSNQGCRCSRLTTDLIEGDDVRFKLLSISIKPIQLTFSPVQLH
jgi:hypothetical protein